MKTSAALDDSPRRPPAKVAMTDCKGAEVRLVNLTAHDLQIFTSGGIVVLPKSGHIARARNRSTLHSVVSGVSVFAQSFGPIQGLPDAEDGIVYVASALVLRALRAAGLDRPDVVAPGTGPNDGAVRESSGKVAGVTRLVLEV